MGNLILIIKKKLYCESICIIFGKEKGGALEFNKYTRQAEAQRQLCGYCKLSLRKRKAIEMSLLPFPKKAAKLNLKDSLAFLSPLLAFPRGSHARHTTQEIRFPVQPHKHVPVAKIGATGPAGCSLQ